MRCCFAMDAGALSSPAVDSRATTRHIALGASYCPPCDILAAYVICAAVSAWVYFAVAEQEISSMLTVSSLLQCLAFVLLSRMICAHGGAGVSVSTLRLQALALACRLSSTLHLNGYLPYDPSGDWIYQVADLSSLAALAMVLVQMRRAERRCRTSAPSSPSPSPTDPAHQPPRRTPWKWVLGAGVLACILHADMDHDLPFDILWTTGLFIDAFSMAPQLNLISEHGGTLQGITRHYVVAMAGSRLFSAAFWYIAVDAVKCTPWVGSFNHGGWGIVAAHVVQIAPMMCQRDSWLRIVSTVGEGKQLETRQ